MIRTLVLAAAALGAAGIAAVPTPAAAGGVSIGIDTGYYGGGAYEPVYHRGYRHRWRDDRSYYGYGGYYRPRPYYGYRPDYAYRPYRPRPSCRTVTVRSWDGYRYVTRTRETCGRRYYRY